MSGSGAGLSGRVVGAEIRRAAKRVAFYLGLHTDT